MCAQKLMKKEAQNLKEKKWEQMGESGEKKGKGKKKKFKNSNIKHNEFSKNV